MKIQKNATKTLIIVSVNIELFCKESRKFRKDSQENTCKWVLFWQSCMPKPAPLLRKNSIVDVFCKFLKVYTTPVDGCFCNVEEFGHDASGCVF